MSEAVASRALHASRLSWKRLRRIGLNCGIAVAAAAVTALYIDGGPAAFMLRADGFVTRSHLAVSVPFESRVVKVFVRPGDHVAKGQKLAAIASPSMSRNLSELAVEKARIVEKIAELEARKREINQVLPAAERDSYETATYLDDLTRARARGLAVNRSMQEMSTAALTAIDKTASLAAERAAIVPELAAHQAALTEIETAVEALTTAYSNGMIYAAASGTIGSHVAQVGEVLSPSTGSFANIYTGDAFVMAYLPDSYRQPIREGEAVRVSTPNTTLIGHIESILPIAETLPADYQRPNHLPQRGRLARIQLSESDQLPLDQRVEVSSCWSNDCQKSLLQAVWDGMLAQTETVASLGRTVITAAASRAPDLRSVPTSSALATPTADPAPLAERPGSPGS